MNLGEEFREDLRPHTGGPQPAIVGSGNLAARRSLTSSELASFTELSTRRALQAVGMTVAQIGMGLAAPIWLWEAGAAAWPWLAIALPIAWLLIGTGQHALFVLAHEAAHYRLLPQRRANDALGRTIGMSTGISMCTYRVTHRLHHNHLYAAQDPDTALHGGYPRGRAYLWRKLRQDLIGLNAWKTYAYFFGSPAINEATGTRTRPLDDTSPELRRAARRDRWGVLAFQVALPLLCWASGGWTGLAACVLLWWLPMLTVLQPLLRLRAICEHGAARDLSSPLTAARTNRTWGSPMNWLGRWLLFPHHVNYHVEHHLYPAVPHYHLPRLHQMLLGKGVLDGAEVADLKETLKRVFAERESASPQGVKPMSQWP